MCANVSVGDEFNCAEARFPQPKLKTSKKVRTDVSQRMNNLFDKLLWRAEESFLVEKPRLEPRRVHEHKIQLREFERALVFGGLQVRVDFNFKLKQPRKAAPVKVSTKRDLASLTAVRTRKRRKVSKALM